MRTLSRELPIPLDDHSLFLAAERSFTWPSRNSRKGPHISVFAPYCSEPNFPSVPRETSFFSEKPEASCSTARVLSAIAVRPHEGETAV